jgi:hypothetical protein
MRPERKLTGRTKYISIYGYRGLVEDLVLCDILQATLTEVFGDVTFYFHVFEVDVGVAAEAKYVAGTAGFDVTWDSAGSAGSGHCLTKDEVGVDITGCAIISYAGEVVAPSSTGSP